MHTASRWRRCRYTVALFGLLLTSPSWAESSLAARVDDLRRHAQAFEKRGEWVEASRVYEEILRRDRTNPETREAFLRCLRQMHLVRRHRDPGYRAAVTRLSTSQALDLYEQVLTTVAATFVDRPRTDLTALFQQGVRELRLALTQEAFLRDHLPEAGPTAVAAFRNRLESWVGRRIGSRTEAREQVLAIARAGHQLGLAVRPGPIVALTALEFAAGACNSLDEYSLFLTPGHYSDLHASLRGRYVGVGIDVGVVDQRLEITRVYPRSPAAEAALLRRDRIVRIDRQAVDNLPPDVAADKLRGEAGSALELEVLTPGQMMSHTVRLVRRSVVMPSVEHEVLMEDDPASVIGYLRIASFQENTTQEVKEALAQFQTHGVRAVILDLRGNAGGAFRAAVAVAELFLGDGVIVHTQSQLKEYSRPYRAETANPFAQPMVVMVDGDTASSAEVLAGALKENCRAYLVGQPTYGKGSMQCVLPLDRAPLDRMPAGIRVTVARFSSPLRNPYSGRGVIPDLEVSQDTEAAFAAARQEARRLAAMMMVR